MTEHDESKPAFGQWPITQSDPCDLVGQLAADAAFDRRILLNGDPEAVGQHPGAMQVEGDTVATVDDEKSHSFSVPAFIPYKGEAIRSRGRLEGAKEFFETLAGPLRAFSPLSLRRAVSGHACLPRQSSVQDVVVFRTSRFMNSSNQGAQATVR